MLPVLHEHSYKARVSNCTHMFLLSVNGLQHMGLTILLGGASEVIKMEDFVTMCIFICLNLCLNITYELDLFVILGNDSYLAKETVEIKTKIF